MKERGRHISGVLASLINGMYKNVMLKLIKNPFRQPGCLTFALFIITLALHNQVGVNDEAFNVHTSLQLPDKLTTELPDL